MTTRPPATGTRDRERSVPSGSFVRVDGEDAYRILGVDRMPPFLISLASDTDLWMFVTSRGGLTAGRVDPDGAIFPYETEDKLVHGHHHTGPVTLLRVRTRGGEEIRWEPWTGRDGGGIERSLTKNVVGNRLTFEERHHGLGLVFRARWAACDELGWVRTVTVENRGGEPLSVTALDGLRNVLPSGVPLALTQQSSSLVDAYKRADLDPGGALATFSLTAKIIDRAEPAEELRASTVWRCGGDAFTVTLDGEALADFRDGRDPRRATVAVGRRGHYLALSRHELAPGASADWHVVADTGRDHVQVAALGAALREGHLAGSDVGAALLRARDTLAGMVAAADGLQFTGRRAGSAHHFANVLFNGMRGGLFWRDHLCPVSELRAVLERRQGEVARRHEALLANLPDPVPFRAWLDAAAGTGDPDLERLAHEVLPLHFGRRHGDPSRPWNRFTIRVRHADGTRALHYEGNWRDIFQNWEALAHGYPAFLRGMIAKFVNASTADGFNPYRITRDGIDWEVEEPDDPWSYIGYWGDHQIVYLLRLLEAQQRFDPEVLEHLLGRPVFSYADVPYRLRSYADIVRDPRATLDFDAEFDAAIRAREETFGTDARLRTGPDGRVLHVTLLEKLLVPALSKLSNLVPGGGIWMNTQRPEWNDANNALVGNGVSVVTAAYLCRYLRFVGDLVASAGEAEVAVSAAVVAWWAAVAAILRDRGDRLADAGDRERREGMDALGTAFDAYRQALDAGGLDERVPLRAADVAAFCDDAVRVLDRLLRANRRADGLYHAYNLLDLDRVPGEAGLRRLPVMLEGQVAALSSGAVGGEEANRLVAALFESPLYRADRRSFLLYPAKELLSFRDRNVVPDERIAAVPLLRALLEAGDASIVARDVDGTGRFHGSFANAGDVAAALDRLAGDPRWTEAVAADRAAVLDVYESVFDHHAFTGRSGTMYGYEGIGCVYWHMVAKLLLAVQERMREAARPGGDVAVARKLAQQYERIRAGLGYERTAPEYGAFPTDPYSHTPPHGGARQPGMTGQVKEEILTRLGELGVEVAEGRVAFRPVFLHPDELLAEPGVVELPGIGGARHRVSVPAGGLAFSFCQVPVVYVRGDAPRVRVSWRSGEAREKAGDRLDEEASDSLLGREGRIERVEVTVPAEAFRRP